MDRGSHICWILIISNKYVNPCPPASKSKLFRKALGLEAKLKNRYIKSTAMTATTSQKHLPIPGQFHVAPMAQSVNLVFCTEETSPNQALVHWPIRETPLVFKQIPNKFGAKLSKLVKTRVGTQALTIKFWSKITHWFLQK